MAKKKINAIKSTIDGVDFDSQLEVYCYTKLKENNIPFTFHETTYTLSPSFKYIGECYEPDKRKGTGLYLKSNNLQSIKYTPDFVGNNWVIETKGKPNENFPMRLKLFKKYLLENGLRYDIYIPKNRKQVDETIEIIKSKLTNRTS